MKRPFKFEVPQLVSLRARIGCRVDLFASPKSSLIPCPSTLGRPVALCPHTMGTPFPAGGRGHSIMGGKQLALGL